MRVHGTCKAFARNVVKWGLIIWKASWSGGNLQKLEAIKRDIDKTGWVWVLEKQF